VPVLSREIDLHPEDLLSRDRLHEAPGQRWWALYTLSRREKDLMRRLLLRGVAFYGPTIPRRFRTPKGRIFTSYVPLFPNYVFLYGTEDDRYTAISLGCVSKCIRVTNGAELAQDLSGIWRLTQGNAPLSTESRFESGRRVRVRAGPFRGCEGFILYRNGQTRLVVAVNFLQQGASLVIEDCDVEDLGEGLHSRRIE
jgi:transcription antitermination factor NusG